MKGLFCFTLVVATAYAAPAYASPVDTRFLTPYATRISTQVVPVATRVATPIATQFIPVATRLATPVATRYVQVPTRIAAEPIGTAPVFASLQPVAVRQQQVLVDAQPLQFGGGVSVPLTRGFGRQQQVLVDAQPLQYRGSVSVPLTGGLGLGFGLSGAGLDGAAIGVADFGGAGFDGSQFGAPLVAELTGVSGGFLAKK